MRPASDEKHPFLLRFHIRSSLSSGTADLGFEDLPCLLFIDSFTDPKDLYIFKIDAFSEESITKDLHFIFDLVDRHFEKPVSIKEPAEHEIAPQIERFVSARRHFITAIASKNNVRRVKIFVKKEGFGLVNMILAVVKPFIS